MGRKKQNGQAMLITVLSLGGAILGVTTIAGLLMLYQIRATTDIESSAKAIFAADSGVEWAEFDYYCGNPTSTTDPNGRCVNAPGTEQPTSTFSDCDTGCPVTAVTCSDAGNNAVPCSSASATAAVAKGSALGTQRAFLLNMTGVTTTLP